jgi:flagellar export protein FliJ
MSGSSYRFRLERVRALRERREDQAKVELASALLLRHERVAEVDAAATRIEDARRLQVNFTAGSALDLQARQAYLERVESSHRDRLKSLRDQNIEVSGRRQQLVEAAQARQALERLKEKGLAAHQREQDRVERIVLDEIAGNGYWRRAA